MNYRTQKNAGFSMIEVLVASTILVVIVMMLAMLFQQTSMAWRTGVRRADSFMAVRSLVGSIQRDAAKAVAENSIPLALRTKYNLGSQNFTASALAFYTLSGNGFRNDDFNQTARRSLSFIEYNAAGIRKETILLADGTTEVISSNVKDFVLTSSKNKPVVGNINYLVQNKPGALAGSLPLSILLDVEVTSQGYNLDIGAASAGPDGAWGTKDDIRTWVE